MPNVRSARTHEIRDRIVAAAETEFGANGYAATTMTAIATRAGVALRTLYNYFPTKDLMYFRDVSLFDDLIELVRASGTRSDVIGLAMAYLKKHEGSVTRITDRDHKAYESLLWTQLEEQLAALLVSRYPKPEPALLARTEAAMITLMVRSLSWPEFGAAERNGVNVQDQWLDVMAAIARGAMNKVGVKSA